MPVDTESADWVVALSGAGRERAAAERRLHEFLLLAARSELGRRSWQLQLGGPEFDDLAYQAAADALLAITRKIGQFRGDSQFTTWAYRFVIFEVSAKARRHFWRRPAVVMAAEDWDRLPDRLALGPAQASEWRDLVGALGSAVDQVLSPRQRRVFVAIALDGVPLDALAQQLGSTRGAIYKTMFDARLKLRAALAAKGYLTGDTRDTQGQLPAGGQSGSLTSKPTSVPQALR